MRSADAHPCRFGSGRHSLASLVDGGALMDLPTIQPHIIRDDLLTSRYSLKPAMQKVRS